MTAEKHDECYCCGNKQCIQTYSQIAMAEFEAQLRKGNKQFAAPIPLDGPRDDTPFYVPYIEEKKI